MFIKVRSYCYVKHGFHIYNLNHIPYWLLQLETELVFLIIKIYSIKYRLKQKALTFHIFKILLVILWELLNSQLNLDKYKEETLYTIHSP